MTISINSVTVPQRIRERGHYVYEPYTSEVFNGLGETITAGLPRVTWRFTSLSIDDYTWWVTTLMSGANYVKVAAVLWNDLDVETSFSQVVVRRPKYTRRANGRYQDVTIVIDSMVAA